jgi:hypothetical protein
MLIAAALYALHLPINQRVLYDVPAPTVTVYTLIAMSAIVIPAYLSFLTGAGLWDRHPGCQCWADRGDFFFPAAFVPGGQAHWRNADRAARPGRAACGNRIQPSMAGESLTPLQWFGTAGLGVSLLLVWFERPATNPVHTHGLLSWLQPPDFPADFYKR